ncbi:MAG: hypothetical protein A2V67_15065 [Deltaproteobacteria bacterium RBG_13_61_14]|nr:MAG: hypothetical protein A2V67_15065 [Deltaproteobacteria bacterium RBG_13_61_14]
MDYSMIERDPDYKTFRIIAEREAELAKLSWEQRLADEILIGGRLVSEWFEDMKYGINKCFNEDGLNFPGNFKRIVQALFEKNCSMEVKKDIFEETDRYLENLEFEDDEDPRYKMRDTERAALIKAWKSASKSAEAHDANGAEIEGGAGDTSAYIFRRESEASWQFKFKDEGPKTIPYRKGFEYIRELLQRPREEIGVGKLAKTGIRDSTLSEDDQLAGIREQNLAEHDDLATGDRETLRALADKKRSAVTKAIERAFSTLKRYGMPLLADHLDATIKKGFTPCYNPETLLPWKVD